ncbi:2OG-Fe(II) oxygenase [Terrimonas sp. NA20]|uniref:2OG-Fe(II) oxygenase n=1 Tax=Terrimonas ginsenosidimutans TaxID=2908004 RepID=A0ABS9KX88_9BACT|nr:2OG-Fe(II) oxygenase [Terrimonas ginsenosidimutans]MCG2616839.1 2OG-Fe(II) oxygenase [Terrimonas ginsenosidimutans]
MDFINKTAEELKAFGASKSEAYKNAAPFPSGYYNDFFNAERLKEILEEFPDLAAKSDLKFSDANQVKLASKGEYRFGEKTKEFMHFLNSQPFLEFLTELTGIQNLIPDPFFDGGGCHQIMPGGMLKIHADFNKHPNTKLDRRLNVLVYLNEDWHEEYGGHFELWDTEMKGAVTKILPLFNRMAIFSTTSNSFHGHPNKLTCPPDRSRKSLALYYYTNGRPEEAAGLTHSSEHNTIFKARPEDKTSLSLKEIVKQITPPIILNAFRRKNG